MQRWRDQAYHEHYEMDLKSTAFNLGKAPGLMFQIRADRVTRLDRIIGRLKQRTSPGEWLMTTSGIAHLCKPVPDKNGYRSGVCHRTVDVCEGEPEPKCEHCLRYERRQKPEPEPARLPPRPHWRSSF